MKRNIKQGKKTVTKNQVFEALAVIREYALDNLVCGSAAYIVVSWSCGTIQAIVSGRFTDAVRYATYACEWSVKALQVAVGYEEETIQHE